MEKMSFNVFSFHLSFQKPADNQAHRQVGHAGADEASDSEVEQEEVLISKLSLSSCQ